MLLNLTKVWPSLGGCSSALRWLRLPSHAPASTLRPPARYGWAALGSLRWQKLYKQKVVEFLPSDFDCCLVIDFII